MPNTAKIDTPHPAEPIIRLSPEEFRQLRILIESRCGIRLHEEKQQEIEAKLLAGTKAALPLGANEIIREAGDSENALQYLINRLTIGESYFFRNRPHFDALQEEVLPELIARASSNQSLNIWSAGCACGEEPYSLLILIREKFPEIVNWKVSVVATDINTAYLAHAAAATYGSWALRGIDRETRKRYFIKQGKDSYRLSADVANGVQLSQYNLMNYPYTNMGKQGKYDLILCRNVLIYFNYQTANRIVTELGEMLRPGGYLFVGHSEAYPETDRLKIRLSHATYYYQRTTGSKESGRVNLKRSSQMSIPGTGAVSLPPPPYRRSKMPSVRAPGPRMSLVVVTEGTSHEKTARRRRRGSVRIHTKSATQLPAVSIKEALREPAQTLDGKRGDIVSLELGKAKKYVNQGDIERGFRMVKSLADDEGRLDFRVHFLHAMVADQKGDVREAINSLKQTLFLHKEFAVGHFYLGVLYEKEGEVDPAKRHFRNALGLLETLPADAILEETEDLPVGRLREIIEARLKELGVLER